MKALVCRTFGPADQLSLEDLQDLDVKKGCVVVEVRAAGVNFPDNLLIQGKYQVKPELPFVPGNEGAGTITKVGEGVGHLAVGDRVIFSGPGAFAEQVLVDANNVVKMPDVMTFEQAGGFSITYSTSYHAFKQCAQLKEAQTVLVLGAAGGVGVTAIELAKAMGATVIAAASTEEKLDYAQGVGADYRINYSVEDLKSRVKELTNGVGVDVIYDPVGGDFSEQAFRSIAWGGTHLVVGFAAGPIPKIPLNLALLKGASIQGVWWGTWAAKYPQEHINNTVEMLEMVATGVINPLVTETYSLDNAVEAFKCIEERRAKGKVVLKL